MKWFKRKKRDESEAVAPQGETKPQGEELVNVYDFETKTVARVPVRELAPFMIQARMEGIEGHIWVDSRELQQGEHRHPPFGEDVREVLREIQSAVDEFYPLGLDEWEDGFRRDTNPEQEIAIWLHLARLYRELTTQRDLNLEQRRDYFTILLACTNSAREHVLKISPPHAISVFEAEDVIDRFFKKSGE